MTESFPALVDSEIEQSLLGAILVSNPAYYQVADFLRPIHFGFGAHARIYEALEKLISRGELVNPFMLHRYFEQDGLKEIGGASYIAQLAESAVTIVNVPFYARTIIDLYQRRELIAVAQKAIAAAQRHNIDDSAGSQIERLQTSLLSLTEATGIAEDRSIGIAAASGLERAQEAYKRQDGMAGLPTGFIDLDKKLGGMNGGDLIVLAGRPGQGKSSLAESIAEHVARGGLPVGLIELEQSAEQVALREMGRRAGLSAHDIRRGALNEDEWQQVVGVAGALNGLPLWIDDRSGLNLAQIRAKLSQWKLRHGIRLAVIDHLHLTESVGRDRVAEISSLTRGLKTLAKQLGIPILVLAQLSRAVEQREDHRPQLSDLRASGSIEEDSDVVIFVYREEYYLSRNEPTRRDNESDDRFNDRYERWRQRCDDVHSLADIIIAKNRHGPIGIVKLAFNAERTEFSNLAIQGRFYDAAE